MAKKVSGRSTIENETIDISESVTTENEETVNENENEEKEFNSKDIDPDDIGKNAAEEKIRINFDDEESINNYTQQKSKTSQNNPNENDEGHFSNTSVEDLQDRIKNEEEKSNKSFSAKEFEDIARFIIFLLDSSVAAALKWWSKDTSEQAYSLSKPKQEQLVYQLTLILVKYQAKFSIEFMFLITVLVLYAVPFGKALQRRKQMRPLAQNVGEKIVNMTKATKTEPIVPEMKFEKHEEYNPPTVNEEVLENETNTNVEEEIKIKPRKPRRRRGGVPKN